MSPGSRVLLRAAPGAWSGRHGPHRQVRRKAGIIAAAALVGLGAAGWGTAASSGGPSMPDAARGALTGNALAPGSLAPGSEPATTPAWQLRLVVQYLPPYSDRSEYDVVLPETDSIWLLGGSNVGGHSQPEAERIINGVPDAVPLPAGAHSWITAASALSPDDIWAVTAVTGSVLRWNGSAWTLLPRGGWITGTRFTGITATGPADVWAYGTSGGGHPGAGTWRWNGTRWSRVTGAAAALYQASRLSATDVWAIGKAKGALRLLLRYDGSAWRRVAPAALAGFLFSQVLALGQHDVWVAGTVAGLPRLGHFDGRRWTTTSMPGSLPATGMCRDASGGLWVIANTGTAPSRLLHYSGGTWTRSTVSSVAADQILACARVPGSTVMWGAGEAAAPQGSAAAAYRHG